jgi:hypothetical protein
MIPLDHFPVITPLGPATCVGIVSNLDDVEWVTFIDSTQEPWFWRNPYIRRRRNVTNCLMTTSPFSNINPVLQAQIDRYKRSGWLPENYEASKPETWKL